MFLNCRGVKRRGSLSSFFNLFFFNFFLFLIQLLTNEKMLTKDELLTIPGNWVNIEDDKEVVNVTIDEEIED